MTSRAAQHETPKISVVMCTFNGSKYVVDQLTSILDQSHRVDEVVVADDGSADATLDLVRGLFDQHSSHHELPELRVLENCGSPLGVTGNFSRALPAAHGDLIFIADQDDVWGRFRVEAALETRRSSPHATLVAHDSELVDEVGKSLGRTTFSSMGVDSEELAFLNSDLAVKALCKRNVLAGMSFCVERRLLEEATPIPDAWPHDYWLAMWAALRGQLSVIADSRHLGYRQHDANVYGAGSKTLRTKAGRLLKLGNDAAQLCRMFVELEQRASETSPALGFAVLNHIMQKCEFEHARSQLPPSLIRRAGRSALMARQGGYSAFASNGSLNILRDLLHAPVGAE